MRNAALFVSIVLLFACDGPVDPGMPDGGADAGSGEDPLRADCEPLVPEHCALPWPSDYFTTPDPSTPTGLRLAIGATTLPRARLRGRRHVDPTPLHTRDGWSVNAGLLAFLPGASTTGLPTPATIERSLEDDSPTVLMNAETGERVPHFAELDRSMADENAPQAFIIRPVVTLEHATRYIVAIRDVADDSGAAIAPSPVFRALRDGEEFDLPYVQARRDHFEQLFTTLADHGVARDTLQLAWDFTTASLESDTAWMLAVRDATLAAIGEDGPDFRIVEIEEFTPEANPHVARRVHVMMTVPLFLTSVEPGSYLNLGPDGMPQQNGTAEFPMVVIIPHSASPENKVRPLQYGHGLLGDRFQATSNWLPRFANENGFAVFGVNMVGMAMEDIGELIRTITSAQFHTFRSMPERLIQGIVNSLSAMRLMLGAFGAHEDLLVDGESVIDTSAGFYSGDSQGGIFGATYMALTTDVTRGVLGVPGQPYNLLLNRSVDFDVYLGFMRGSLEDGVDIQIVQNYMQQLWDRAEPGSYSRHIMNDPLPGTPPHQVLLQAAIGDHQVTTLGAHIMARGVGAVTIAPQTRPIWGIEEVVSTIDTPSAERHTGSAIVEFDFGLEEPLTNVPVRAGDDPHGEVRKNPRAQAQTLHFFETGEIIHTCDGPCDPE